MGPNVSNIIYSSFENLLNAMCRDQTLFVGSQCNDANIAIYIGDIAVIFDLGFIGPNAVIGLIGELRAPGNIRDQCHLQDLHSQGSLRKCMH